MTKKNKTITEIPLVNAHVHAAMVAFRGQAEDLPLKKWLEENIWPRERKEVTPGFVAENGRKAIKEMKKNRIQAFCDMYFFAENMAKIVREQRIRAVLGEVLLNVPNPSYGSFAEGFQKTEQLIKKYKKDKYVIPSVAPHSIYALSKEELIISKELAKKNRVIWQIHLAETEGEVKECLKKNKFTPVGYLDSLGLLDEQSLLIHCVFLTEEDLKIIKKRKSSIVHCPLSNLKLGSGIAPVFKMLALGINVALGTDGAASSNRLDIWEAGKFAAYLQKGITHNPAIIKSKQIFEMMSINGMKALGIEELGGEKKSQIKREINKNKENLNLLYEKNINDFS